MKKLLSLLISSCLLLGLAVPAMASTDEPEPVPEPLELIEPGINYFDHATIGGQDVGGAFYVYGPEHPHMYDMLSSFLNGVVYLYPDRPVADGDEALALIQKLGLDEIAESFPAYIVVPVPVNGSGWSEADLDVYWNSQFWLAGGEITFATEPPQGEYVRHTMNSLQYVLGEGSGATFINNVLSQNAQRIAGIATFGGEINKDLQPGLAVPAYLVNASDAAVRYWKDVNGTDTEDGDTAWNSGYVQKKVITAKGGDRFDRENVQTAWTDLLSRTMRLGVAVNVVITTSDRSDWVLMDWLELDSIGLELDSFEWNAETHEAEYYDEYMTKSADSVHVYVPEAVKQNPEKEVPLLVVLHGKGDDPLNVVVGCGWAQKAVDENFILLAPATEDTDYVMGLIDYVKSLYAIDDSRVYCTGFSMGGANTSNIGKAHPEVFAAIAPMGAAGGSVVEGFDNDAYDLPVSMIVGSIDTNNISEDENRNPVISGIMNAGLESVDQAFAINGIDPGERDFAANPYWGYTPDAYRTVTDKELEWQISDFYSDKYDVPVVQLVTLVGAAHSNADYMATIAWDFLRNFARGADGSLQILENAASGETGGDVSEEAYKAYLKEFVDAVPAVSDEHFKEFCALIDAGDYTTMPADMMFNASWWGYAVMTYDEFAAAGGVYEIPAFDPGLTAD